MLDAVVNDYAEISAKLKSLRVRSGLSTRQLARRTGFSQSKITKLENGVRRPRPDDVSVILRELNVLPEIQHALVLRSQALLDQKAKPVRDTPSAERLVDLDEFTEIDEMTREVLNVEGNAIPLWFQTAEYTESRYWADNASGVHLPSFMRNKTLRKVRSETGERTNYCIIDEAVLWRPTLAEPEWFEQLQVIQNRLRRPGVELGIVPSEVASGDPLDAWWCMDRRAVLFEPLGSGDVLVSDQRRVVQRIDRFEELSKVAVWGGQAIKLVDKAMTRLQAIDLREPSRSLVPRLTPNLDKP